MMIVALIVVAVVTTALAIGLGVGGAAISGVFVAAVLVIFLGVVTSDLPVFFATIRNGIRLHGP